MMITQNTKYQFPWNKVLIAIGVLIVVIWSIFFIDSTIVLAEGRKYYVLFDDAMISMRYADFFSRGHGLIWNVGEKVEGYTNLLWTIYMAGLIKIFGHYLAPLAVQITGLFLSVATLILSSIASWKISYYVSSGNKAQARIAFVVSFILVATLYPLHYWSLMGMEVSVLSFIAALCAFLAAQVINKSMDPSRGLLCVSALMVLAYFVRPDGFITVSPIFVALIYYTFRKRPRAAIRIPIVIGIVALVLIGLHTAWRINYYGASVPNTFTLKMEGYPLSLRISNGIGFISIFAKQYSFFIAAAIILYAIFLRRFLICASLIGCFLLAISYQIYAGGDPWIYWRQLVPGLVELYIMIAIGIAAASQPAVGTRYILRYILVAAALVGGVWATNIRFAKEILFKERPYSVDAMERNVSTAIALRSVLNKEGTVLAFWAGAIPYYWEGKAIDPLGKTDPVVARLEVDRSISWSGMAGVPGHAKHDLRYSVLTRMPDYIQYAKWGTPTVQSDISKEYSLVDYKGTTLCLRNHSPMVKWNKIKILGSCVE